MLLYVVCNLGLCGVIESGVLGGGDLKILLPEFSVERLHLLHRVNLLSLCVVYVCGCLFVRPHEHFEGTPKFLGIFCVLT